MSGIFNIHPRGGTSITCALLKDGSTNYQVDPDSINPHYDQREEILYSDAERGGSVRKVKQGLVPFEFTVIVFGSTQADAIANARTLKQAIANADGGYIEYRPIHLASDVMSTYFHYLRSRPPLPQGRSAFEGPATEQRARINEGQEYSVKLKCQVMTKAWATSDPETLVTIVNQTGIYNHDDAGHNNYVVVQNSTIKGDAIIPLIQIEGGGSAVGFDINRFIIHKRKTPAGSSTNLDWVEGEDKDGDGNWTPTVVAGTSGGSVARTSQSSYLYFGSIEWDSDYLGKVAPIICARISSGSETYRLYPYTGQGSVVYESSLSVVVSSSSWFVYHGFSTLDLPPIKLPVYLTDDTAVTIGEFLSGNNRVGLRVDRLGSPADLDVDFCVWPLAEDWIAYFESGTYLDEAGSTFRLHIDAISELTHMTTPLDGYFYSSVDMFGVPLSELILKKGFDHRLRFIGWHSTSGYDIDHQLEVTVRGIFGTVYPFNEAIS